MTELVCDRNKFQYVSPFFYILEIECDAARLGTSNTSSMVPVVGQDMRILEALLGSKQA